MTVTVHLTAQLRAAAGAPSVRVDVPASASAAEVAEALVELHAPLRPLIFQSSGQLSPGVLAVCRDEQVEWSAPLNAGELTLIAAISGG